MNNLNYDGVNIDANVLEEQNEILKKQKNDLSNVKKISFDPKNYLDLKLKEGETTKTLKIRFLPVSVNDSRVFFNINTHALKVDKEIAKSGFKSFVCLNDEQIGGIDECPICKKTKELFEKATQAKNNGDLALSKSLAKEAYSLKKKTTFISRVIDRDHEEEGVKFWRFNANSKGEGIYDKLMSLYQTRKQESIDDGEEKPYNIFDIYNGKDIIIVVSKSQIPDGFGGMKDTLAYNITDSGSRKPLSKDVEKANLWLHDTKTWKDVYSNKTAEYLEIVVNGKIPVFNRELNKFVEKEENEASDKNLNEEIASEILNQTFDNVETNGNENNSIDSTDVFGEELPF